MLRYSQAETLKKTPYQISKLFEYHKEYNPQQFRRPVAQEEQPMDDIDIALGGF